MELTPLLGLRDVTVRYPGAGAPALAQASLEVAAGEGVALLGANGAGKTTLLRSAMALVHPASGTVEVCGRPTAALQPEDLADVAGYAFQNPEDQLFERTVRAELAFGPRQLGRSSERIAAVTAELLDALGLAEYAETHPYDLPAPRRRLVALAATMASEPRLLLLDEPTAGLDQAGRRLVEAAVRRARERGAAVVAVTHDADLALECLDRAVVLAAGRIAREGPARDVLGSAAAVPALPPTAELATRLGLGGAGMTRGAVAAALAARCRNRA